MAKCFSTVNQICFPVTLIYFFQCFKNLSMTKIRVDCNFTQFNPSNTTVHSLPSSTVLQGTETSARTPRVSFPHSSDALAFANPFPQFPASVPVRTQGHPPGPSQAGGSLARPLCFRCFCPEDTEGVGVVLSPTTRPRPGLRVNGSKARAGKAWAPHGA